MVSYLDTHAMAPVPAAASLSQKREHEPVELVGFLVEGRMAGGADDGEPGVGDVAGHEGAVLQGHHPIARAPYYEGGHGQRLEVVAHVLFLQDVQALAAGGGSRA